MKKEKKNPVLPHSSRKNLPLALMVGEDCAIKNAATGVVGMLIGILCLH
jgi:hypothetical protein